MPDRYGNADDADETQKTPRRQAEARDSTATARLAAIDACAMCDHDGYRDGAVCGHNPNQAEINARGIAACRAALAKPAERVSKR